MVVMVALVFLVTWVVLGVTEKKVETAYSAFYGERYERQIDEFLRMREARMSALEAICERREHLNAPCEIPVEIGIGIATGVVVAGCMGSKCRLNYTVVGDRVNLASRLCSTAKGGEILIDGETWKQAKALENGATSLEGTEERISLKGVSGEVTVRKLVQQRSEMEMAL